MHTTKIAAALLGLAVAVTAAGCSSSGTESASTTTEKATTTRPTLAPLTIVVTDDDGISAPGIDVLSKQLAALPEVTVKVVAPATNQSGKGDTTTEGTVTHQPGKTASGMDGVAVNGTPADSVNVALDQLGLKPDLVASGINKGQNVGNLASISGTVGATLTAARRGIPGVAGSAGIENPSYAVAAKDVVAWVVANRARLAAHKMPTAAIVNFNVPECTAGSPLGLVQVPTAKQIPEGVSPFTADCAATPKGYKPTNDVDAIAHGFAAQSPVPIGTTRPAG